MSPSKKIWIGWVMSALAAFPFIPSAVMKFMGIPQVIEGMTHLGWPLSALTWLKVLEISVAVIYLVPRTAVLGAILLTGYIGGAMATHLRIGEAVYLHIAIGLLVWGGLYLRDPRLQALLPLRKPLT